MNSQERRELLQKVTGGLVKEGKTAKDLAKELDLKKTDVNSILYAAQNLGLVDRTAEKDPKTGKEGAPEWILTFENITLGNDKEDD